MALHREPLNGSASESEGRVFATTQGSVVLSFPDESDAETARCAGRALPDLLAVDLHFLPAPAPRPRTRRI